MSLYMNFYETGLYEMLLSELLGELCYSSEANITGVCILYYQLM